jgi:hypothetical protein
MIIKNNKRYRLFTVETKLIWKLFLRVLALDFASGNRERAIAQCLCNLHVLVTQTSNFSDLEIAWDTQQTFFGDLEIGSLQRFVDLAEVDMNWDRWLLAESSRTEMAYPIRSIQASDNIDPDAVVLYEDVAECILPLICFQNPSSLSFFWSIFVGIMTGWWHVPEPEFTEIFQDCLLLDLFIQNEKDIFRVPRFLELVCFRVCSLPTISDDIGLKITEHRYVI